jgi:hypothetical protein
MAMEGRTIGRFGCVTSMATRSCWQVPMERQMEMATEPEILTASEAMRKPMDYFAHSTKTVTVASLNPTTLACQHGSAFRGDGAGLLRELATILQKVLRAEMG